MKGIPTRKGRTLLILGHVGQGQRSRLLKIKLAFLQSNSRRYFEIKSKLGLWSAHKERKNPVDFGSGRSRSYVTHDY